MPYQYKRNPVGTNQFTERPKREVAIIIGPSIAYVPLTRGLFTLIEAESVHYVSQWNWQAAWSGTTKSYYAVRMGPPVDGKRQRIFMHHDLCPEHNKKVDHRNRNTLDNRKSGNLRKATLNQQSVNRRVNGKSGLRGAIYVSPNKYRCGIKYNGKHIHLGYFTTAESAHEVYKEKAVELFGDFACFE